MSDNKKECLIFPFLKIELKIKMRSRDGTSCIEKEVNKLKTTRSKYECISFICNL